MKPQDPRGSRSNEAEPREERTTIAGRRTGLDPFHEKWLREVRKIDPDVAMDQGCCSVTLKFAGGSTAPAFLMPCVVEDREVAWAARWGRDMKRFVSSPDAGKNLVFGDQIWVQDELLCTNRAKSRLSEEDPDRIVVLTEGHLDALSCRMAGFVGISVPNGTKSSAWIEAWAPKLAELRRLVLWFDDDEEGNRLLTQLRSLTGSVYVAAPPKIFSDTYIKDANDLLVHGGLDEIKRAILGAKRRLAGRYNVKPTRLLYPVMAFSTGLDFFDSRMLLCCGEHTAIIGRASSGKSKLANYWVYKAAQNSGQRVYYQSFETVADGELTQDLGSIDAKAPIEQVVMDGVWSAETIANLRKHVVMLEPSLAPKTRVPWNEVLNRIVEQADDGVRIHLIDNYAMVANPATGKNENTQTRDDIIALNEIARRYDIAVVVCYHVRKSPFGFIQNKPLEIEDASGSAAIGNHCCLGITLERVVTDGVATNNTNIAVRKARRTTHGRRCEFNVWFEDGNQTYNFGSEGFLDIKSPFEKRESRGAQMSVIKGGKEELPL